MDLSLKIAEKIKKDPYCRQAYDDYVTVNHDNVQNLKWVCDKLSEVVPQLARTDVEEARQFMMLHRKALRLAAPHDFDSYLQFVEWNREPQKKFYIPRRKALLPVVKAMQELADGKLDLLTISLPPGIGKLLADDTPVMTREGYKNHGDLVVGDEVVGLDGKWKKVLHVFPKNRADRIIAFSNGEKIKAHGNHEWVMYCGERIIPRIISTDEMYKHSHETYRLVRDDGYDSGRDYVYVESIHECDPVQGNCIMVEDGIYRVGHSMLPTHNSTLSIFLLTWLSGKHPELPILVGSHSNAWVRGAYDECLRIFDRQGGEYLWHEVFPDVPVCNTNAKDCRIDLGDRKRFETLEFTSISASNSGLYRARQLLYVDDLVSGIEVAMSKDRLDKLWETYVTDFRQRKIGECAELHVMTRWSVHDVVGRLEEMYSDNERCKFLTFPAMDENDESNFDYPYGVGFSTDFYRKQREIMDDVNWRALYQNQPIEREGQLYSPDELQRYFDLPDGEPDAVIAVCDTKDRGSDDCVMPVAYVYGDRYYIEDILCDNSKPEVIDELLVQMLMKHKVKMARFESNSAGGRVAVTVQQELRNRGSNTKIETKYTTANKYTKIQVNSPWVKSKCLFKDDSVSDKAYKKAINKLCSYTTAGKNKHDDVPDAFAQLAEYAENFTSASIQIIKRPF